MRQFYLKPFVFSENAQLLLFGGGLLMYLLAMFWNITIILLICLVSQLHTPMYFFLCCLSVQDIVHISTILPKLLAITISGDKRISLLGCITQIFLFGFCVVTEFLLLTSMAYDRYVAICIPLHYSLIMNKRMCVLLATISCMAGFLDAFIFCLMLSYLSFCNAQEINHFFCDPQTMLKLSCSDTTNIRIVIAVDGVILGWFPLVMILSSYVYIISTILKIKTSEGRCKTFSNCSSHLTVVILLYGTCLSTNMIPEFKHFPNVDKFLSMLYMGVVPMLNPLVYSLRNKEVLRAIQKCLKNFA